MLENFSPVLASTLQAFGLFLVHKFAQYGMIQCDCKFY